MKSELQKTNFGLISKNWKLIPFEEIMLNLQNGLYKSKEFVGKGTKIVKMGNQYGHPRIYEQEGMDRYDLSNDELKKHQLEFDDLLFSRRSLIFDGAGECSIVKEKHIPLVIESSIIRVILNKDIAVPDFYFYFFQSHLGKQLIRSINQGTSISGITGSDLKKIQVPLPSILEQKSIINSFLKIDDLLENIQNQNHILEQTTQAIFKSWFVDFDGVTEFEDSELGKIPQGWKIVKLCEISKVIDSAHITPKYSSNGLSMVRVTNIQNGFLNLKGTLKVTRNVYEEFSKNYKPQKNDILMSRVGTYGIVCFVGTDEPFCLGQNTVVIHSILNYFIYHNLISKLTQNQIEAKIDGSTQKTITLKNIRNLLIVKPNEKDEEIIKKFNEKISTIFENIINNNYQIHVLTKTRDALLPKLMSGEIRV